VDRARTLRQGDGARSATGTSAVNGRSIARFYHREAA